MVNRFRAVVKPAILTLCGIVAIFLFFLLPPNREWVMDKIFVYRHEFQWQVKRLDIEDRKRIRLESAYTRSVEITSMIEKHGHKKEALVLLPPTSYFKQHRINYDVPEPASFYYFTGLSTVRADNSNAADANWYVCVKNGKIVVDSVIDKKTLADTIASFKKFGTAL
jgi:hypothetical protein